MQRHQSVENNGTNDAKISFSMVANVSPPRETRISPRSPCTPLLSREVIIVVQIVTLFLPYGKGGGSGAKGKKLQAFYQPRG